jgi:virginiamycin B lyase
MRHSPLFAVRAGFDHESSGVAVAASPHPFTGREKTDDTSFHRGARANRVGSVNPDGAIEVYDLPTPASEPHGIALGPDHALWTALETGSLARVAIG